MPKLNDLPADLGGGDRGSDHQRITFEKAIALNPIGLSPLLMHRNGALRILVEDWCQRVGRWSSVVADDLCIRTPSALASKSLPFHLLRRCSSDIMSLGLWRDEDAAYSRGAPVPDVACVTDQIERLIRRLAEDFVKIRDREIGALIERYALLFSEEEPCIGQAQLDEIMMRRTAHARWTVEQTPETLPQPVTAAISETAENLADAGIASVMGKLGSSIREYCENRQKLFGDVNLLAPPSLRVMTSQKSHPAAVGEPSAPVATSSNDNHEVDANLPEAGRPAVPPPPSTSPDTRSARLPASEASSDSGRNPTPSASALQRTDAEQMLSFNQTIQRLINHTIALLRAELLKDITEATQNAELAISNCERPGEICRAVRVMRAELANLDRFSSSLHVKDYAALVRHYSQHAFDGSRADAFAQWLDCPAPSKGP